MGPLNLKENLRVPRRPPGPYATPGLRKQSLDSKSPYSRKLETSGFRAHLSGPSYNLRVRRLPSGPCIISRCALLPLKKRIVDEDPALKTSLNTQLRGPLHGN
ncbi:hypothetical protein F2Q68_00004788 [Brassica cretica]|uniref:Uncharacterized protein n=2 Tax=Brassica cretica TaxID=69181 RepID=A0ABQ7CKL8_BRACR|nr:hypothetical protein F2Q68_00004788 [Brassica cretica]KAF3552251.1 hypothetical protein DY000_02007170 [Brassica cretica]